MPELPEVETSCRGIEPHLVGQEIKQLIVRNAQLRWAVPVPELSALVGQVIQCVERRGKYIKIIVPTGYILIHFGMSGSLRVLTQDVELAKHDHVDLILNSKKILRYNDPRRFGCWLFQANDMQTHTAIEHPLLASLGPEPMEDDFDAQYLYGVSRKKTQSIKTFIMDSHVVVGVGNIYAAESLFRAGINPKKAAGKISLPRFELLVEAIKAILGRSIQQGGTTLRDFTNSEGRPGYFKQQLMVYGRENEPCHVCASPIKNIKLGQRSTFYCQVCQN